MNLHRKILNFAGILTGLLLKKLRKKSDLPLGQAVVGKFSDGETRVILERW